MVPGWHTQTTVSKTIATEVTNDFMPESNISLRSKNKNNQTATTTFKLAHFPTTISINKTKISWKIPASTTYLFYVCFSFVYIDAILPPEFCALCCFLPLKMHIYLSIYIYLYECWCVLLSNSNFETPDANSTQICDSERIKAHCKEHLLLQTTDTVCPHMVPLKSGIISFGEEDSPLTRSSEVWLLFHLALIYKAFWIKAFLEGGWSLPRYTTRSGFASFDSKQHKHVSTLSTGDSTY